MLRCLVAIPLIMLLGCGSSAVVQVVAWGGMLLSRTIDQGWDRAVDSTFDGQHPCTMCKAADSLRKAEDVAPPRGAGKQDHNPVPSKMIKKAEALECSPLTLPVPSSAGSLARIDAYVLLVEQFRHQPEPPPPRC